MKKHERSTRDTHEIHQNEHDEGINARRVILVGGGDISLDLDTSNVTEAITEALKGIKLDIPQSAPQIQEKAEVQVIEVPTQVFVPQVETKIIEVPVQTIVTEYKVVEIEKPIITEIIKTIEIEKPIILEKVVEKTPSWAWALIIIKSFIIVAGAIHKYAPQLIN